MAESIKLPKAVISNRIYIRPSEEYKNILRDKLTYIIKSGNPKSKFSSIETIRNYKIPSTGIYSLPQGRIDLIPENYEIEDKRVLVPVDFPEAQIPLNSEQEKVYNEVNDSWFINAKVGWGKTFLALHLAKKLGQKTLIVVHTLYLRDQWMEECNKIFGFIPDTISGDNFQMDTPIVVGNIQTLTKYNLELSKVFGTIVLDEAHHVPADTFQRFIDSMHSRYRIALSGTINRKDGKQVVFNDYFGLNMSKPPVNNTMEPTVHIIKTGVKLATGQPWVKKINNLLYSEEYQQYVASLVSAYIARGHKVLILANRVEFLENCQKLCGGNSVVVTSTTSTELRNLYKEMINEGELDAIFGSSKIFAEGVSINRLSCLMLPEPSNNSIFLEQVIGRVQRLFEGKPKPIAVDFNFADPASRNQNNARLEFYLQKGWQIEVL